MDKLTRAKQQDLWDREHTRQIRLKLNLNTDADLIEYLDSVDNKQGLIKRLLREEMTRMKEGE